MCLKKLQFLSYLVCKCADKFTEKLICLKKFYFLTYFVCNRVSRKIDLFEEALILTYFVCKRVGKLQ